MTVRYPTRRKTKRLCLVLEPGNAGLRADNGPGTAHKGIHLVVGQRARIGGRGGSTAEATASVPPVSPSSFGWTFTDRVSPAARKGVRRRLIKLAEPIDTNRAVHCEGCHSAVSRDCEAGGQKTLDPSPRQSAMPCPRAPNATGQATQRQRSHTLQLRPCSKERNGA